MLLVYRLLSYQPWLSTNYYFPELSTIIFLMEWLIQLVFPPCSNSPRHVSPANSGRAFMDSGHFSTSSRKKMELLGGSSHLVIANHGELMWISTLTSLIPSIIFIYIYIYYIYIYPEPYPSENDGVRHLESWHSQYDGKYWKVRKKSMVPVSTKQFLNGWTKPIFPAGWSKQKITGSFGWTANWMSIQCWDWTDWTPKGPWGPGNPSICGELSR